MKLLLVDNFDSFVYNLAQAFGSLGADPVVVRNDASAEELEALAPDGVVISPGPGTPEEAGVSIEAVRRFGARMPLLGVCLGHQCIGAAYGGVVSRAPVGPKHGKTSAVEHDGTGVLAGLPSPFIATRYHSLAIEPGSFPEALEVTARSDDGTVMALRHRSLPVEGVQFHPESVLTPEGPRILANFLETTRRSRPARLDERSAS
ncbi:MAG: aminodeoxychorismate/anthranilate synthase component II [Actinomycetota bacterium]|nr:aminodeoxychorismate/anthranilate synthase component II [Actinomycetota bacterium]